MAHNLLITGAGDHGQKYAPIAIDTRKNFKINNIILVDSDEDACKKLAGKYPGLKTYHTKLGTDALEDIIRDENVDNFIGAVEQNLSIAWLETALNVRHGGKPQITHILQESTAGQGLQKNIQPIIRAHNISYVENYRYSSSPVQKVNEDAKEAFIRAFRGQEGEKKPVQNVAVNNKRMAQTPS